MVLFLFYVICRTRTEGSYAFDGLSLTDLILALENTETKKGTIYTLFSLFNI
jgi:hypothetical protein